ncbi:MAG: TRAP transporter small permease [Hyphomicrobiaceae bacterium]|nr:TRAP transporter small permease [Hyphomicrobiaceae bacterium]
MLILSWLARVHDRVTIVGAWLAALCIGAITLLYCGEVVTRYFLRAPSSWSAAVAVYLMLGTVLLVMPHLVMQQDHVAITVADYLAPRAAHRLALWVLAASLVVCAVATFISYEETARAFSRGVRTTDTLFIPKWWLLAPVVYGLGSSTLHFARQLVRLFNSSAKAPKAEASVG